MAPLETIETTHSIASLEFLSKHSELHHYTNYTGLEGIFRSNTLWATHFTELNDSAEVILLKEPLKISVTEHFKEILRVERRKRYVVNREIERLGGLLKASKFVADDFVNIMYGFTFHDEAATTYSEPYIASFCSHAKEPYEAENGLLSQWRGYGKDDNRYCIVFDAHALAKLIEQEAAPHFWIYINIDEVQYATNDVSVERLFPKLLDTCDKFLIQCMERGKYDDIGGDGFLPFLAGATLYKHQGFIEEREVRIVAVPGTPQLLEIGRKEHKEYSFGELKKIYQRNGQVRRHISLFEGLNTPLPIKRIIVGPSRNQKDNYQRAKELLGEEIPLIPSDTPFIG